MVMEAKNAFAEEHTTYVGSDTPERIHPSFFTELPSKRVSASLKSSSTSCSIGRKGEDKKNAK